MFNQLKNIESAFRHIKWFSVIYLIAATVITCFAIFRSYDYANEVQQRVYIIAEGRAIEAFRSSRKENIAVEGRRHVMDFHGWFFNLSPDDKAIEGNMKKAMYLADNSAKRVYDDLKENSYFTQLISSNTSQELTTDSIKVNTENHPYYFQFYGKLRILRPLSMTTRSLLTEGYLRDLKERTDNDPNGFLIEHWKILDNRDLETQKR